jgi:hypothetical protein
MKRFAPILLLALVAGLLLVPSAVAAMRQQGQPHMTAALQSLKDAQGHLKEAEHNKGGHRADAANLVDQAIKQVKMGIDAGEENH